MYAYFVQYVLYSDTMYNYQIASHQGNRHVLSEFFIDISLSSQATQPSEDRGTEELLSFFAFWLDCRWRFVRTVIIIVVIMAVFTTVGFSSLGFVWLYFSQIYITITIDLMMMTMIMVNFHYLTAHREKRVCLTACAPNCINIISIFHVILCYYTTFCFYIMKIWCDHHIMDRVSDAMMVEAVVGCDDHGGCNQSGSGSGIISRIKMKLHFRMTYKVDYYCSIFSSPCQKIHFVAGW